MLEWLGSLCFILIVFIIGMFVGAALLCDAVDRGIISWEKLKLLIFEEDDEETELK